MAKQALIGCNGFPLAQLLVVAIQETGHYAVSMSVVYEMNTLQTNFFYMVEVDWEGVLGGGSGEVDEVAIKSRHKELIDMMNGIAPIPKRP